MEHFVATVRRIRNEIMEKNKINTPIIMTPKDTEDFDNATNCFLCETALDGDKVRDHCHYTGNYRGCAHSNCNLHFNYNHYKIPVFLHNLKGYDAHLIICNACEFKSNKKYTSDSA